MRTIYMKHPLVEKVDNYGSVFRSALFGRWRSRTLNPTPSKPWGENIYLIRTDGPALFPCTPSKNRWASFIPLYTLKERTWHLYIFTLPCFQKPERNLFYGKNFSVIRTPGILDSKNWRTNSFVDCGTCWVWRFRFFMCFFQLSNYHFFNSKVPILKLSAWFVLIECVIVIILAHLQQCLISLRVLPIMEG